MIVADTSALISLSLIDLFELAAENFEIHTTETVIEELQGTEKENDQIAEAAGKILENRNSLTIHRSAEWERFQSSRIHEEKPAASI